MATDNFFAASLIRERDAFTHLLSSYLDMNALSNLDIAMTNNALRVLWLECLGSVHPTVSVNEYKHTAESFRWMTKRGIKASTISFTITKVVSELWGDDDVVEKSLSADGSIFDVIKENDALKELSLRGFDGLSCKRLSTMAQSYPNLTSIDLSFGTSKLTKSALTAICSSCKHLTEITLTGTQITVDGLVALAEGCPELTDLNISRCKGNLRKGYAALKQHCPQLGYMRLSNTDVDDESIRYLVGEKSPLDCIDLASSNISDDALRAIGAACAELSIILLKSCNVTEEGLEALARGCHLLEEIDISETNMQRGGLSAINVLTSNCPNMKTVRASDIQGGPNFDFPDGPTLAIKHLELARSKWLVGAGLSTLIRRSPDLYFIDLEECPLIRDETLMALAEHCPGLKYISLESPGVTDAGFISLTSQCRKLETVFLFSPRITDPGIRSLAQCKNISFIYLEELEDVTDSAVAEVVRNCHQLRSLTLHSLSETSPVSDETVALMVESCPNLTELSISYSDLTDASLRAIATGLTKIDHLDIMDCPITDEGLMALTGIRTELTLMISCSDTVTEGGFARLVAGCANLKLLEIRSCEEISREFIERLRREYPQVVIKFDEI